MNKINTAKNKIKEYGSHILTSKRKNLFCDIDIKFEDNNIKLLNYIFYIFIVIIGFTFKYERNNDIVSNDDLFMFL